MIIIDSKQFIQKVINYYKSQNLGTKTFSIQQLHDILDSYEKLTLKANFENEPKHTHVEIKQKSIQEISLN